MIDISNPKTIIARTVAGARQLATRRLAPAFLSVMLLFGFAANVAAARTIGIVPPANPQANCTGGLFELPIAVLNRCRAKQGVGPLVLPSNYSRLPVIDQLFVVINLERVSRGLPPVVSLTRTISQLAARGAQLSTDPSFPPTGSTYGGSVWAQGSASALGAVADWMYDDGPGGFNLDCTATNSSGCWGHRDILLGGGSKSTLMGGAGYDASNGSYTFEIDGGLTGQKTTLTWAHELRYFRHQPGIVPLTR
jgi:hypothetical protein